MGEIQIRSDYSKEDLKKVRELIERHYDEFNKEDRFDSFIQHFNPKGKNKEKEYYINSYLYDVNRSGEEAGSIKQKLFRTTTSRTLGFFPHNIEIFNEQLMGAIYCTIFEKERYMMINMVELYKEYLSFYAKIVNHICNYGRGNSKIDDIEIFMDKSNKNQIKNLFDLGFQVNIESDYFMKQTDDLNYLLLKRSIRKN